MGAALAVFAEVVGCEAGGVAEEGAVLLSENISYWRSDWGLEGYVRGSGLAGWFEGSP